MIISGKKSPEKLIIEFDHFFQTGNESYWLYDSYEYHENSKTNYILAYNIIKDDASDRPSSRIVYTYAEEFNKKHIRLIKDK